MSDYLKYLVQQIKKYGQVPGIAARPSTQTTAPAPAATTAPGIKSKTPAQTATPAAPRDTGTYVSSKTVIKEMQKAIHIKEMQKAIQDFAAVAVQYKIAPGIKDPRKDFNDFLAEQFCASADIHGDEYSPDPGATSRQSKQPTDIVELSNVIDGLRRIGPGSKEAMADGVWDMRTNNAVKNTYALAGAIVAANDALGNPNSPKAFVKEDLDKLKQSIPTKDPTKMSQDELIEKAQAIIPVIEKLSAFYKVFSSTIMNSPFYKRYMSGDKSQALLKVEPGKDPAQLDAAQSTRLQGAQKIMLPVLRIRDINNINVLLDNKIPLSLLQSKEGIRKIMTDYLSYTDSEINNRAMARVIQSILAQVNTFLSTNKVEAPAAPAPVQTPPSLKPPTPPGTR